MIIFLALSIYHLKRYPPRLALPHCMMTPNFSICYLLLITFMIHHGGWGIAPMVLSNPLPMHRIRCLNPISQGDIPKDCILNSWWGIVPMALLPTSQGIIPMAHLIRNSRGTIPWLIPSTSVQPGYRSYGSSSNLQLDNHDFISCASAYTPDQPPISNCASFFPI